MIILDNENLLETMYFVGTFLLKIIFIRNVLKVISFGEKVL